MASQFLTPVGELAGEARCQPEPCTEGYWSTITSVLGSGVVRLERRINETAYWLHLSKAKVLHAGSSSGSGVEAPAANFF